MYIFIDTETGGQDETKHSLLTLSAGLYTKEGDLVKELELYLRPNDNLFHINAGAIKYNKINMLEVIEKSVFYKTGWEMLLAFIKDAYELGKDPPTLVGHRLDFDIKFIEACLGTLDRKQLQKYTEDTACIAKFLGFKFENLADLARQLEISVVEEELHGAKYDRVLTKLIYFKLKAIVAGV